MVGRLVSYCLFHNILHLFTRLLLVFGGYLNRLVYLFVTQVISHFLSNLRVHDIKSAASM